MPTGRVAGVSAELLVWPERLDLAHLPAMPFSSDQGTGRSSAERSCFRYHWRIGDAPLGTLLAHLDASAMMAHMASISPEVLLLCIVMILTLSAIVAFRVRACFLSAVSDRLFALVAVVLCTIASPRPRRSFVWLKKSPIRTSRSSFARG